MGITPLFIFFSQLTFLKIAKKKKNSRTHKLKISLNLIHLNSDCVFVLVYNILCIYIILYNIIAVHKIQTDVYNTDVFIFQCFPGIYAFRLR